MEKHYQKLVIGVYFSLLGTHAKHAKGNEFSRKVSFECL